MTGNPTTSGAPPGPADDKVGLVLQDRYRIIRKLGQGGMGSVYEANHELIGKRVAVKTLNPEFMKQPSLVERFKREARAATAAGNEHIIDVTDLGELPDGSPYIVMEYLDGQDFAALLESGGALPIGRAVRIVSQVCDALAAAHAKGIVHRDLKPENIYLISRKGDPDFVKVLDFGISKMREVQEAPTKSLTQTGTALGTPHYMSPEQAQGLPVTDNRTDIYALGVILYYALTGVVPFDSESYVGLIVQILQDEPMPLRQRRSDIPAELERVVLRCLSKKADNRYATVEELAAALTPYLSLKGQPTLIEVAPTLPPGPRSMGPDGGKATAVGAHGTPEPAISPYTGSHPESALGGGTVVGNPAAGGAGKWIAVVLVAGVLLGVGGYFALGGSKPKPAPTPTEAKPVVAAVEPAPVAAAAAAPTPAPAPVVPAEVQVSVSVMPADAKIFIGDTEYSNPVNAPRPRSLEPVKLRVTRDGYEPHEETIVFSDNKSVSITLNKTERRSSRSTSNAAPQKGPDTGGRRDKFRDSF